MTLADPIPLADQQHFVLTEASWELYEQLLRDIGDRPLRVTFDNGNLEMMAPLPVHEYWKKRISRLIELMAADLRIEVVAVGAATFRRKDLAKGLEPDECYYIQSASLIRGKDEIDLPSDPPPDLAVEIDITHRSVLREPIYAALGVPELWRFNGRKLQPLILDAEGRYQPADSSNAFSFLPIATFEQFLFRLAREDQTTVIDDFRAWIRTLKVE